MKKMKIENQLCLLQQSTKKSWIICNVCPKVHSKIPKIMTQQWTEVFQTTDQRVWGVQLNKFVEQVMT